MSYSEGDFPWWMKAGFWMLVCWKPILIALVVIGTLIVIL